VQVMLDSDIAALFQVDVKRLNQQMKRNPDRFPEDFCFQLTTEEFGCLKSQFATSFGPGGKTKLPYVYTEQGIIALAGVLRSGLADKMAVEISRVFVSMRRFILENGDLIKRVAELQSRQIAFENETARKFDALFSYVDEKSFPKQMTFFDGQWFDAYDFLSSLFEKADTSILLIDPYCDREALRYCAKRKDGVRIKICHGSRAALGSQDVRTFSRQYGPIDVKCDDSFHDRYLILDAKECYHIGASLNHAGKRVFGISRVEDGDVVALLLRKGS
ncbi:MAG: ORF6N domain-containing protein, partial [Bacilli bacterium]|nr:ORF6N domain-containing protein [Bacilli bacterium]